MLTLNRCRQLSKNPPDPPLFLTDNIKLDRITTKIKWKGYDYFTLHLKFWEGTSVKICKIQLPALLFLVVLHQFFYNFLELHSLSKKKIFITNFPFLTDLPKSPFLYRQKSANHDSFFCWYTWIAVAIRHPITMLLNMSLKNATIAQSWSNLVPLVHSCSDPGIWGIWVGPLVISHMKLGSDTLYLYFFNVSYNNNPKISLASLTSIETTLINSTTLWKFLFLVT